MKKLLAIGLLLCASYVHADKGDGTTPTFKEKMWISTTVSIAASNVLLASAPICIHAVKIGSPTVNIEPSYIQFYASTWATFNHTAESITARINLNVTANAAGNNIFPTSDGDYNVFSSSYTWFDKKGASHITILYDWVDSTVISPRRYFGFSGADGSGTGAFPRR